MGTHPSKRFEDGVLVERAISSDVAGEPDESDDFTQRPAKDPDTTTDAQRGSKAVGATAAENKSIKATSKK